MVRVCVLGEASGLGLLRREEALLLLGKLEQPPGRFAVKGTFSFRLSRRISLRRTSSTASLRSLTMWNNSAWDGSPQGKELPARRRVDRQHEIFSRSYRD